MFSRSGVTRSLGGLCKWLVLLAAALVWLWLDIRRFAAHASQSPQVLVADVAAALAATGTKMAIALVLTGLVDYGVAWWSWTRQTRLTRTELAAELREAEGHPLVRSRRRQAHSERVDRRGRRALDPGDLLLVGAGRLAVAVRGIPQSTGPPMQAPARIVLRGVGTAAERLRQAARALRIQVIRDDAVARALYRAGRSAEPVGLELAARIGRLLERRGLPAISR
jgi:flagellar biosynthetic protein FlhB